MKQINISRGFVVKVCDCHYKTVALYKWSATRYTGRKSAKWYAIKGTHTTRGGKHIRHSQLMHRFIMNAQPGQVVDHIDGNTLNNQCRNLRLVSRSQNNANQNGAKVGSKSGIKGVYWHKGASKWCAEVVHEKKKYYLGLFDTLEEARVARNEKAQELHGDFYNEA